MKKLKFNIIKIQIITFYLLFTLYSCSTNEPQLISVSNLYKIEIPSDMSPMTTDINEDASLQYANLFKEKYLMIIHEDKREFMEVMEIEDQRKVFKEFVNTAVQGYEESLNSVANIYNLSFNGLAGKKIEIDGVFDDIDIVWHSVLIEGEENLYQICFWTLKGRENRNMEQLFNSKYTE